MAKQSGILGPFPSIYFLDLHWNGLDGASGFPFWQHLHREEALTPGSQRPGHMKPTTPE